MSQVITLTNRNNYLYVNGLNIIPVGSIMPYAASNAPDGWLLCDGNDVNRNEYSTLFSIIGTTYGSSSPTTFKLPNLKDKFPMGKSQNNILGEFAGSNSVSLNVNNLPAHNHTATINDGGNHSHTITDPGHTHTWNFGLEGDDSGNGGSHSEFTRTTGPLSDPIQSSTTGITINSSGSHNHSITIDNTGSGTSFDITNPYIVLNYIIRY